MRDQIQELVDALELDPNDIVLDMVLVARVGNPKEKHPVISMSTTDDVDFGRQLGMLHECLIMMDKAYRTGDDA